MQSRDMERTEYPVHTIVYPECVLQRQNICLRGLPGTGLILLDVLEAGYLNTSKTQVPCDTPDPVLVVPASMAPASVVTGSAVPDSVVPASVVPASVVTSSRSLPQQSLLQ